MLVSTGFQEGNIAGFKWSKEYVDSNDKLETDQVTITRLQEQNDALTRALNEAKNELQNSDLKLKISSLTDKQEQLKDVTRKVQMTVSTTLDNNAPSIEKTLSTASYDLYSPSNYTVGVQTLGISDKERVSINKKLSLQEYNRGALK